MSAVFAAQEEIMQTRYFTSAFVRKGDSIVMVKHQGAADPEPYWALPGGRVEIGETVEQAIIREVWEETGLTVHAVGALAYIVELHRNEENELGLAYVYEITDWSGEFSINDPDNKVHEVRLIPLAEAIEALAKISYLPMCAPPVAYLCGEAVVGTVYRYRVTPTHDAELMTESS